MLFIAQIVLLSCTADDETVSSESDAVVVTFTIAMDKSLATRTYWGEDVERDVEHEWENTIEYGKLQVLFYDDNNQFIGQLSDITYLSLDATATEEYSVVGKLKLDNVVDGSKLSGKVVLLANYDEAVANPTKGEAMSLISDNAFSYDPTAIKNRTKYIPMWGIQTYSFTIQKGMASEIADPIDMLRAMAKVRLKLNNEKYIDEDIVDQTYTLSNVRLDHYCTNGYTVPEGFADASSYNDNVFATKNLKTIESFRGGQTKVDQLYFEEETGGKSFIVYIPEYPTGGNVPQIQFTLTKKDKPSETKDFIVQLKDYSDGKPTGDGGLEILRNTIYEYTIRRVINTSEVELTLRYEVEKWKDRSADIIFN